ncbi:RNA-directed DNA polymerase, eukaryota [Tanacetum coccineum]|uniref:RNA-directed DNA polymerase, eukaryota n=1 Tax=Tanacetum coccineum TaxID=301880 RepID=A0ABQ5IMR9_9ASTR
MWRHAVEGKANQVSHSIFVTNFPSGTFVKQLWDICEQYGKVVDSFIPDRVSKEGKKLAFVRFSNVKHLEVLIGNLNTVWIGKFHLRFNVARFQRGEKFDGVRKGDQNQPVRVNVPSASSFSRSFVAAVSNEARSGSIAKHVEDKPVMVIDDDCLYDKRFDFMLMAKVKSFDSMPNLGVVLKDEGFKNVTIRYVGGLWVSMEFLDSHARDCFQKHEGLDTWFSVVQPWKSNFKVDERVIWMDVEGVPLVAWTNKTFIKIAKRWGDMVFSEDSEDNNLWRKRLCVVTKVENFIMESFKIIIKGKVYTVRALEIIGWIPDFMEEENDLSSDSNEEVSDKSVSLNDFCSSVKENVSSGRDSKKKKEAKKDFTEETKSGDPFGIYDLLNHNGNKASIDNMESGDFSKPPGFSNFIADKKVASENDEGRVNLVYHVQKNLSNLNQNSNHVEVDQQAEINSYSVKGGQGSERDSVLPKGKCPLNESSLLERMNEFVEIGLGQKAKKQWVRELCCKNKISFLSLQETKMEEMEDNVVRSLWGNMDFDYSHSPSVGFSVEGVWKQTGTKLLIIGELIVMGDFNEDRIPSERHGQENLLNARRDLWKDLRVLDDIRDKDLVQKAKMFHSWFDIEGFDQMVKDAWNSEDVDDLNEMTYLKKKFQKLKKSIISWVHENRGKATERRKAIQDKLFRLDKQIDQEGGQEDLLNSRRDLWKDLWVLDDLREKDFVQKAKVKWAIEGDENSKYFHGVMNKKRHELAIRGISVNGEWVMDPHKVKQEFFQHFANRFSSRPNHGLRFQNEELFPVSLNKSQQELLEVEAVKCFFRSGIFPKGCNPSFITLIPKLNDAKFVKDFRPISLIGCQYKIVGKILANRLSLVIGNLISKEQSAFIRGRKILDGPLILSEVIDWCNQKKNKAMIFKFDFEKAYDSVKWEFLDMILNRFGFGEAWRTWIKGCLTSSSASTLVNSSPTQEFYFEKGLRQGDPLSPFLFLLVMEALHLSFVRAVDGGFFKGVLVGSHELTFISHLFYADDAMFISEWREENLRHLFPSVFLKGLNHVDVIFFCGVEEGSRKVSWFSWDSVVASKDVGCLGMSSFLAMNCALLFKWIWRFKVQPDAMWVSIIKVIHGRSGSLDCAAQVGKYSTWLNCIRGVSNLKESGIDLFSCMEKKVSNGCDSLFWEENCMGGGSLQVKFSRLFALENNKEVSLLDKIQNGILYGFRRSPKGGIEGVQLEEASNLLASIELVEEQDKWVWNLEEDGEFKVASARRFINEGLSEMEGAQTRWVKLVPIKVNVFAWRLALNKLPTRFNMSSRRLDIPSIVCPVCNVRAETVDHLFFSCSVASPIMVKILGWWDLLDSGVSSYHSWVSWFEGLRLKKVAKDYLEAIFLSRGGSFGVIAIVCFFLQSP